MRDNPIQFAVVREDPVVEAELIRATGAENLLLIGSGGCTALTLQALFPHLRLTLVDANAAQLALIRRKMTQLERGSVTARKHAFNIGIDDASGLNACGNFESLFRCFRRFLNEFVLTDGEMTDLFRGVAAADDVARRLIEHKYWAVAFDLHFSNSLLEAMFGPAAVQHAPPGSYPDYFRQALVTGLMTSAMRQNYFLHHILLGCYLDSPTCLPHYLVTDVPKYRFQFIEGNADQVPEWAAFDLVDLSNIFDWMAEPAVADLALLLARQMRPGARLLFRQLNHTKDFSRFFAGQFAFDKALGEALLAKDRSLFYSKLNIATKL